MKERGIRINLNEFNQPIGDKVNNFFEGKKSDFPLEPFTNKNELKKYL